MSANGTGRTPLIAGNWKMYKTVERGGGVHRGAAAARLVGAGRRRGDLPAVHGPRGDGRLDARLARPGLRPEHAPRRSRARSPARCRRRCCSRSACTGVILGHSERRELFGETDRALQLKVPAALEAGLVPILCVGETEEEREARRHRAQAPPSGPGGPGAGRHRAARRRGDRLRADLGDRDRPGGHARAGPGGGRVHPRAGGRPLPRAGRAHPRAVRRQRQGRELRRAAVPARHRRRAGRRREPRRRRSFAAIVDAAAAV